MSSEISPVRCIDMTYRLSIYRHLWKMVIFENIDIDKAIPKILISIWWFWKISISIRSIWEILISISISIKRSWKYRYLKRILTITLSTFMDILVNCIKRHSMKFMQKIIHFCAQGLPGLSLNFFYCKQANLQLWI